MRNDIIDQIIKYKIDTNLDPCYICGIYNTKYETDHYRTNFSDLRDSFLKYYKKRISV